MKTWVLYCVFIKAYVSFRALGFFKLVQEMRGKPTNNDWNRMIGTLTSILSLTEGEEDV